jgi:hypothetical protein
MISPGPGLISEKDRRADSRRGSLEVRVGLLLPHSDPLGILLVGPIQGRCGDMPNFVKIRPTVGSDNRT